jgi:hypothetical protein
VFGSVAHPKINVEFGGFHTLNMFIQFRSAGARAVETTSGTQQNAFEAPPLVDWAAGARSVTALIVNAPSLNPEERRGPSRTFRCRKSEGERRAEYRAYVIDAQRNDGCTSA